MRLQLDWWSQWSSIGSLFNKHREVSTGLRLALYLVLSLDRGIEVRCQSCRPEQIDRAVACSCHVMPSASPNVFKSLSAPAKIFRVIPTHTADVERTFSQLRPIKTVIRKRMSENTLDLFLASWLKVMS